jgi:hypothetical protein
MAMVHRREVEWDIRKKSFSILVLAVMMIIKLSTSSTLCNSTCIEFIAVTVQFQPKQHRVFGIALDPASSSSTPTNFFLAGEDTFIFQL